MTFISVWWTVLVDCGGVRLTLGWVETFEVKDVKTLRKSTDLRSLGWERFR